MRFIIRSSMSESWSNRYMEKSLSSFDRGWFVSLSWNNSTAYSEGVRTHSILRKYKVNFRSRWFR